MKITKAKEWLIRGFAMVIGPAFAVVSLVECFRELLGAVA
jgi:hypothetical protein